MGKRVLLQNSSPERRQRKGGLAYHTPEAWCAMSPIRSLCLVKIPDFDETRIKQFYHQPLVQHRLRFQITSINPSKVNTKDDAARCRGPYPPLFVSGGGGITRLGGTRTAEIT